MPRLVQGDIFGAARHDAELAIVFGYIGFNRIDLTWRAFAKEIPSLAGIRDPFEKLDQPYEYKPGRWLWFIRYSPESGGLTDADTRRALDQVLSWAQAQGVRTVVTNGAPEAIAGRAPLTRQKSDDRRARFLIELASEYEQKYGLEVTLSSLDRTFIK